jgi:hypothetical protein
MTFPLRDLITVTSFEAGQSSNQIETSQLVSFILNAGGLMPDMRTPTWYTYSLWTAFAVTLFSLTLGVIIHCINLKYPYKLSTRWVRWCIPVAVSYFFLKKKKILDKQIIQSTFIIIDFIIYPDIGKRKRTEIVTTCINLYNRLHLLALLHANL